MSVESGTSVPKVKARYGTGVPMDKAGKGTGVPTTAKKRQTVLPKCMDPSQGTVYPGEKGSQVRSKPQGRGAYQGTVSGKHVAVPQVTAPPPSATRSPLLALCAAFLAIVLTATAPSPLTGALAAPGQQRAWAASPASAFLLSEAKQSDPDTSDLLALLAPDTLENGRIWTDKSVNADRALITDVAGNPLNAVDVSGTTDFAVTLSALSQGYSVKTVVEPSDVVFILDVSWSMITNNLGSQTRAQVMVGALNNAIIQIMNANPENRVAVVAYGGSFAAGRNTAREQNVLPLGRYDTNKPCFTYSGPAGSSTTTYLHVNPSNVSATAAALAQDVQIYGATPTQWGIAAGAEVLANNPDTTYTDPTTQLTVNRRPNIILLTDGEPTFAWEDFAMASSGFSPDSATSGTGQAADLGMDLLTVATASYWKQKVTDRYYGVAATRAATFYTIGVGTTGNLHALAVMDPKNHAQYDAQAYNGDTYTMESVLDDFIASAGPVGFPSWDGYTNAARTLFSITNTGGYLTSYHYTDGFYPAEDENALNDAFASIAQSIITSGAYATNAEGPDSDPNFTGNVVFQDVLGEGFEFKELHGFSVYDQMFTSSSLATDLIAGAAVPNNAWNTFISVLTVRLGITSQDAADLVRSCIAHGSISTGGLRDSVQVKWYAQSDPSRGLVYQSGFFDASGAAIGPPAGATCTVSLYSVQGSLANPITGANTDLMYLYFEVVTALERGTFTIAVPDTPFDFQVTLEKRQQGAFWYIPASLIPQRTVKPVYASGSTSPAIGVDIVEVSPIRACYTVGPWLDLAGGNLPKTYPNAKGD
ncbi:MAG: VWA domain-containing protein, partial [Coriobacteriaceae bacterium]|nr:VWA domain-containing protein [Coriobacteriaceae bacterium]